jgi:hypothetical protein
MEDRHRPAPVPDLIGDDRTIQYAAAIEMTSSSMEYWMPRMRGA